MDSNIPLLAICIPTYNRYDILNECLLDTISKVRKYSFPIVVADNASTDGTQELVQQLAKEYPYLIYYRQPENLGADRNFEFALKHSPAAYSWLLGDSYRVVEAELDALVEILESGQHCAIINNSFGRIKNLPSKVYSDPDRLLYDIGWHMTIMCSLIVSRDLIHNTNFMRYYDTNFIQDGIIFEYLSTHRSATIYWYDKSCNTSTSLPKSTWSDQRWQVFGVCWTAYILSLPSTISLPTKCKCINQHNKRVRLFTVKRTIRLRIKGNYDLRTLRHCKPYQKFFWDVPYIIPYLIAVSPKWLLRLVY